jgi:hypothetical protein
MALDRELEITISSKYRYQRETVILMATFMGKNMSYTRKYTMLI